MEKLVNWKYCLNENMCETKKLVKWKNWLNRKWLNGNIG